MHITITEVAPRDGLQSEKRFISTDHKLRLIEAIFASGIRSVEITSFVAPAAVPQMADASKVMTAIAKPPGAIASALTPNLRGAHGAITAGADEVVVFASASATHNQKNLNRSIDESIFNIEQIAVLASQHGVRVRAAISTAFGCPFEGDVPVQHVVDIAKAFSRMGIRHISLADTTGMATPRIVHEVVEAVKEAVVDARLALHFHNTRGLGLVNVAAGLELGIDEYESSLGGIGGCPFAPGATGNVCTEDLVHFLHEMGHTTGVDLDSLVSAAHLLEEALGRPLPGQVMRAGKRLQLHDPNAAPVARAR